MNRSRIRAFHIVFFIFVVSNIGGALTPIGDPPLFLGYLRGVPFFWLLQHVAAEWVFTLVLVLAAFYGFDRWSSRPVPAPKAAASAGEPAAWRCEGAWNLLVLLAIVGAVFLPAPFFVREIVMLGAAVASYFLSPQKVHRENAFSFAPIREVAFLFAGIFTTMMPALGYLAVHGEEFGFTRPLHYYIATGLLSAVLDNAPTYLNFLQLAQTTVVAGLPAAAGADATRVLLEQEPLFVVAISLGAVFFGAMTYIGNGPNFMVRSIALEAGVPCPTFFGYVFRFSLPILLPILALSGWLFL